MKQETSYFKRPEIAEDAATSPILIHPVVRLCPFEMSETLSNMTKEEWEESREIREEIARKIEDDLKRRLEALYPSCGKEGAPSASNANVLGIINLSSFA